MINTADQILDAAMTLPPDERMRVAEELLKSVNGPDRGVIDAEWVAVAEKRLSRFRRGETTAMPLDDAIT